MQNIRNPTVYVPCRDLSFWNFSGWGSCQAEVTCYLFSIFHAKAIQTTSPMYRTWFWYYTPFHMMLATFLSSWNLKAVLFAGDLRNGIVNRDHPWQARRRTRESLLSSHHRKKKGGAGRREGAVRRHDAAEFDKNKCIAGSLCLVYTPSRAARRRRLARGGGLLLHLPTSRPSPSPSRKHLPQPRSCSGSWRQEEPGAMSNELWVCVPLRFLLSFHPQLQCAEVSPSIWLAAITCSSFSWSATPPSASPASSSGSLWVTRVVRLLQIRPNTAVSYPLCAHPGRLLRRQLHQHHRCWLCEWAGAPLGIPLIYSGGLRGCFPCILAGRSTDHPFPLVLFGQKIRTIEMDGKTIKLQIVSSPFSHVTFMKKIVQYNILLVHNVWIPDY